MAFPYCFSKFEILVGFTNQQIIPFEESKSNLSILSINSYFLVHLFLHAFEGLKYQSTLNIDRQSLLFLKNEKAIRLSLQSATFLFCVLPFPLLNNHNASLLYRSISYPPHFQKINIVCDGVLTSPTKSKPPKLEPSQSQITLASPALELFTPSRPRS